MKLAILTSGTHDSNCGGCPACSEANAQVLRMNDNEYAEFLTAKRCQNDSLKRMSFCLKELVMSIRRPGADGTLDGIPAAPSLLSEIQRYRGRTEVKALKSWQRTPVIKPVAAPEGAKPTRPVALNAGIRDEDRGVPAPPDMNAIIRAMREKE